MPETAVIAGLGPGFCEELAWTLAGEGYSLALFARSEAYLDEFETDLRDDGHDALAIPVDLTAPDAVSDGFERVRDELGPVEVLAYTASTTTDSDDELDPGRFEHMWRLYALGGLLCAEEAMRDMLDDEGTILFFGAAPEAGDYAFRSGKGAARGLALSLAERYGPRGVHVAHLIVDGMMLNPDVAERAEGLSDERFLDPAAVADVCLSVVEQDRRAWTWELDVRPYTQSLHASRLPL